MQYSYQPPCTSAVALSIIIVRFMTGIMPKLKARKRWYKKKKNGAHRKPLADVTNTSSARPISDEVVAMSVPKLLSNDSSICNCLPNFIVLKTEIGLSSVLRGNWVYHLAENTLQLVYLFFSLPAPPIIKFTVTIMSCLFWTIAVYGRDM